MFTTIHHVSLSVADLKRSIAFYTEVGFTLDGARYNVENDYFRKIICYPEGVVNTALMSSGGSTRLELMQYVVPIGKQLDLATANVGSTHICFVVEDIKLEMERLIAAGARFKTEAVEMDAGPNKGGFAVYFLDPDGYTMELLQLPQR